MKKIKLTPEEKAEIKKEKKSWDDFIRRMAKKGAIVTALFVGLASCSLGRYNQESINLKPQEDKYHVRAVLVKVQRNMKGYKHWFVTDKSDTLIRNYYIPLKTDSCYMVWKTKLDK